MGKIFMTLGLAVVLWMIPIAQTTKGKIGKLGLSKLKTLCTKKVKRWPTKWKKKFVSHICDRDWYIGYIHNF